jgi:hypothetical protein
MSSALVSPKSPQRTSVQGMPQSCIAGGRFRLAMLIKLAPNLHRRAAPRKQNAILCRRFVRIGVERVPAGADLDAQRILVNGALRFLDAQCAD